MPEPSIQKIITMDDFLPLRNIDEELSVYDEMSVEGEQKFYEKINPERLVIEGLASFYEEVDAGSLIIEGRAVFTDRVLADSFLCSGEALAKSNLICDEVLIEGKAECYGRFHATRVDVKGELELDGRLDAIDVVVPGVFNSHGKVVCDNFTVTGFCTVRNLIRAININVDGAASALEAASLKCESLTVKNSGGNLTDYILKCDSVFCDNVKVEYCKIDKILCEDAEIGEGCHVRLLECHSEPVIGVGAIVENIVYI